MLWAVDANVYTNPKEKKIRKCTSGGRWDLVYPSFNHIQWFAFTHSPTTFLDVYMYNNFLVFRSRRYSVNDILLSSIDLNSVLCVNAQGLDSNTQNTDRLKITFWIDLTLPVNLFTRRLIPIIVDKIRYADVTLRATIHCTLISGLALSSQISHLYKIMQLQASIK